MKTPVAHPCCSWSHLSQLDGHVLLDMAALNIRQIGHQSTLSQPGRKPLDALTVALDSALGVVPHPQLQLERFPGRLPGPRQGSLYKGVLTRSARG